MQTIVVNESAAAARRILFVAELPAARNEVQRIDLGDIGAADTFTLTYSGQTTGAISYNATPATIATDIDTALEALSNIDASAITVAHVSAQLYDVTFAGNLASTDIAMMTLTPTGFTPGTITQRQHGGVDGAPARLLTFAAADIQVSKNGAAYANSAGTVTELGHGAYYYEATAGEVDTEGFLSLVSVREDIAMVFPTVQILPTSTTADSFLVHSGTAQSGTSSDVTLASGASSTNNLYVPGTVFIRAGTGAGQRRGIFSYNGSTKLASVEPNFVVVPDNTSELEVYAGTPVQWDLLRTNHAIVNSFGDVATPDDVALAVKGEILDDDTAFSGADIAAIEGRLPAALVSGRMAADSQAIGGSTTTADKLVAHTGSVLKALMTTGSTTNNLNLNTTTGIDGGVPSAVTDFYVGRVLVFYTGALAGQAKAITAYNGTTKVLTTGTFTGSAASGDLAVIV